MIEKLNVAIVEDNDDDAKNLQRHLTAYAEQKNIKLSVSRFSDGEIFLMQYGRGYDIVFMDIEINGKADGMRTSALLREKDRNVALVFVTNFSQKAVEGYNVEAKGFLVKPVDYASFSMLMKRLESNLGTAEEKLLTIKGIRSLIRIKPAEIKYVEVIRHTLTYHTDNGDFDSHATMREAEATLTPYNFFRINNGYLVNMARIDKVAGGFVTICGEELKISRPKKESFLVAFSMVNFCNGGGKT